MKQGFLSPRIAAIGSMLLLFGAATLLDLQQTQAARDQYRRAALQSLGIMRTSMTHLLDNVVVVADSLALSIAAQQRLDSAEFDTLIDGFVIPHPEILGVGLFKQRSLTERYQRRGDVELRLDEIPQRTIVNPLRPPAGKDHWRLEVIAPIGVGEADADRAVIIVVDLEVAIANSSFEQNFAEFNYLLQDPNDPASRELLLGDASVLEQRPVSGDIRVGDQTWQLAAVPKSGWQIAPRSRPWTRLLSALLIVSGGSTVWLVLGTPRWRQQAVGQAVSELERREQEYRTIVDKADTIIICVSETGTIERFNQYAGNIFGFDADVIGQNLAAIVTTPDRAYFLQEALRNSLRNGHAERETHCIRSNGETVWVAWNFRAIHNSAGAVTVVIVTGTDVTQRHQREADLHASETELSSLIQAMNDAIFVLDRNGIYTRAVNTRTRLFHNADELVGRSVLDTLGPEFGQNVLHHIQTCIDRQTILEFEYSTTIYNQNLWLDAMASPLSPDLAVLVVRDVSKRHSTETELRQAKAELEARVAARAGEIHDANKSLQREVVERMQIEDALRQSEEREREKATQLQTTLKELQRTQAQLVQTEKMSSLGQLAAGMAHEINNPVNFIHGNIQPIRNYTNDLFELIELFHEEYPETNEAIEEFIEDIDLEFLRKDLSKALDSMQSGTDRIHSIMQSLQNFSRLDETGMKRVDLREGIHSALAVLRSRLRATKKRPPIEVVYELNELPLVMCYPGQINQVIINLLENAIDALEEQHSTATEPLANPPQVTIRTQTINDDRVSITIADNANGMPPEVVECMFNPFFTTKPVGKGTGLGLSVAYQTVHENHGGQLFCRSAIGQGTELQIVLPIVNQEKNPIQQSTDTST